MTMNALRRAPALVLALAAPLLAAPLLVTAALASPAQAGASLSIPLQGAEVSIITARYSCAGGPAFDVQYVNAGENSLALIPVDGVERVFVQAVSASGARYVSGRLEWWSKGDNAMLDDLMTEAPAADCTPAP